MEKAKKNGVLEPKIPAFQRNFPQRNWGVPPSPLNEKLVCSKKLSGKGAKLELSTLCTKVSPCGSISSHIENRQPKLPLLLSSLKQERPKPPCSGCCPAAESEELRREIVDGQTSVGRSSVGAQTSPGEPRPWSLLVSNRRSTCEVVLGFAMVFVCASKLSVGTLIFYFSLYL